GFDAASHRPVIGVVAQRLKRDQRQGGRRGIEFPVGLPRLAVIAALARIEAPRAVGVLNRPQPRLVLLQLLLNARPELRSLIGGFQLIPRETRRRRVPPVSARGRRGPPPPPAPQAPGPRRFDFSRAPGFGDLYFLAETIAKF